MLNLNGTICKAISKLMLFNYACALLVSLFSSFQTEFHIRRAYLACCIACTGFLASEICSTLIIGNNKMCCDPSDAVSFRRIIHHAVILRLNNPLRCRNDQIMHISLCCYRRRQKNNYVQVSLLLY